MANINAEVDTALVDINLDHLAAVTSTLATDVVSGSILDQILDDGTATFDRTSDSLQAIRDRGDAAWAGGGGGSGGTSLLDTTVAVVNSQTEFTLTASAPNDDDAINDMMVVLRDASNSNSPSIRLITDYVASTGS